MELIKKLIKFCIVGGSGTLIGLGVLYFGTHVLGWFYLISYALSFVISVISNYTLNTLWTFKGSSLSYSACLRYAGTSLFTLGISTLMMYVLTSVFGIWYMFSSVIVTVCVFPINYLLSRMLVWRVV